MTFEMAERIVRNIRSCDKHLNEVANIIEEIADPDEKREMRRKWANACTTMYVEILRPIEIRYPELKI